MLTAVWSVSVSDFFPAEELAVRAVRRYALAQVRLWSGLDRFDTGDLAVIVGELFANAIRHGQSVDGVIPVTLRWRPGRVRFEVYDASPKIPVPRMASLDALDGRGLALVEHLADTWGFIPRRSGGKTVFADLIERTTP